MRSFSRAAGLLLLLLAPVFPNLGAAGETDPSAPTQSLASHTADRIREAWAEIQRLKRTAPAAEAERQQQLFAKEFFDFYLAHPETTPGQQALATAFRMWSNTGDHASIETAMGRVERGSPHWVQLIELARPAYIAAERRDEYREMVARLAGELTDPDVAAEVWLILGRDYRSFADLDRAADCFRSAIALEAHPRLVDAAQTALRALDRLAIGKVAPRFSSTDLQGRPVSLSELEGKFVLLVFWSSKCTACLPELDHLRWVRAAYPADQLALIGVALDARADPVRRFVDVRGMDWPQIFDGQALDGPVPRLYEVREGPRSFLIDPDGLIVARDISGQELDALLAERLPETGNGKPEDPRVNGQPAPAAKGQEAPAAHRD